MPKQKTHKGSKKRFRVTATGKVMHRAAGTSHLATHITQKRVRQLRGTRSLAPADAKRIKNSLRGNSY
jgi:large subunit ribosomal protein L35